MKKPGGIAIMIGPPSKKDKEEKSERTALAEGLIDAVKDGDAEGVAMALDSFYALCREGED